MLLLSLPWPRVIKLNPSRAAIIPRSVGVESIELDSPSWWLLLLLLLFLLLILAGSGDIIIASAGIIWGNACERKRERESVLVLAMDHPPLAEY